MYLGRVVLLLLLKPKLSSRSSVAKSCVLTSQQIQEQTSVSRDDAMVDHDFYKEDQEEIELLLVSES